MYSFDKKLQILLNILLGINIIIFTSLFLYLNNSLFLSIGITISVIMGIIFILQNIEWNVDYRTNDSLINKLEDLEKKTHDLTAAEEENILSPSLDIRVDNIENTVEKLKEAQDEEIFKELENKFNTLLTDIKNEIDENSQEIKKIIYIDEMGENLLNKVNSEISKNSDYLEIKLNDVLNRILEINKIFDEISAFKEDLKERITNLKEEILDSINEELTAQVLSINKTLIQIPGSEKIKSEIETPIDDDKDVEDTKKISEKESEHVVKESLENVDEIPKNEDEESKEVPPDTDDEEFVPNEIELIGRSIDIHKIDNI